MSSHPRKHKLAPAYSLHDESKTWKRTDTHAERIIFSDGDESEKYLHDVLSGAKDLTSGSPELLAAIRDWPSEYHLSPQRHNLIRPFSWAGVRSILELGCGCGAITRVLGELGAEHGAEVHALEAAPRRAALTALRCRDLPNVRVITENIERYESVEKYDVVTLIGVLEYSRIFIDADDPVLECLRMAVSHLAPGGTLIVAIENQLGLKYFNGHFEDHLNLPFAGIENRYDDTSAVTFGRQELLSLLARSGVPSVQEFFPFPDYKVPTKIINKTAFSCPVFKPEELLAGGASRTYPAEPLLSFDEQLVWRTLARNNLIPDFANSFLFFAQRDQTPPQFADSWLAAHYSSHPAHYFDTESKFRRSDTGVIVEKVPLRPRHNLASVESEFFQVVDTQCYVPGEIYHNGLKLLLTRGGKVADVAAWARTWIGFLEQSLVPPENSEKSERLLPGSFIDCVPFNLIEIAQSGLVYIDREWQSRSPIPFNWVFVRGLVYSVEKCSARDVLQEHTYSELVREVASILGIPLTLKDLEIAVQNEIAFINFLFRTTNSNSSDDVLLTVSRLGKLLESQIGAEVEKKVSRPLELSQLGRIHQAFAEVKDKARKAESELNFMTYRYKELESDIVTAITQVRSLDGALSQAKSEIFSLRSRLEEERRLREQQEAGFRSITESKSWQVTAPLRGVASLFRMPPR